MNSLLKLLRTNNALNKFFEIYYQTPSSLHQMVDVLPCIYQKPFSAQAIRYHIAPMPFIFLSTIPVLAFQKTNATLSLKHSNKPMALLNGNMVEQVSDFLSVANWHTSLAVKYYWKAKKV